MPHELGGQLHDRLGRPRHGLLGLCAKLGLGERWSLTRRFHARTIGARPRAVKRAFVRAAILGNRRINSLGKPAHPADDSVHHGLGLLGKQRVAGVVDHHHADAVAQFVAQLIGLRDRMEWIAVGLQVEDRPGAGRPPFRLLGRERREPLAFVRLGIPALEPDGRIVARGEERLLQVFEPLFLGQAQVAALGDGGAQLGRIDLGGGGRDHHAAHQLRIVGRRHACDKIPEGVADEHRRSAIVLDHLGHIASIVVQRKPGHRSLRVADAARLRTQHMEALRGNARRHRVIVLGVAAPRRQEHHQRAGALRDHVNRDIVVAHHLARALGVGGQGRLRRGQQAKGDERQHGRPHGRPLAYILGGEPPPFSCRRSARWPSPTVARRTRHASVRWRDDPCASRTARSGNRDRRARSRSRHDRW